MTTKNKLLFFVNKGFSVSYIARLISVETSTLTKWLNNQKNLSIKNEEKVESALRNIIDELSSIFKE